jgi:hypothetical protein
MGEIKDKLKAEMPADLFETFVEPCAGWINDRYLVIKPPDDSVSSWWYITNWRSRILQIASEVAGRSMVLEVKRRT